MSTQQLSNLMPRFARASGGGTTDDAWGDVDNLDVEMLAEYLLDDGNIGAGGVTFDFSIDNAKRDSTMVSPENSEDGNMPPVAEQSNNRATTQQPPPVPQPATVAASPAPVSQHGAVAKPLEDQSKVNVPPTAQLPTSTGVSLNVPHPTNTQTTTPAAFPHLQAAVPNLALGMGAAGLLQQVQQQQQPPQLQQQQQPPPPQQQHVQMPVVQPQQQQQQQQHAQVPAQMPVQMQQSQSMDNKRRRVDPPPAVPMMAVAGLANNAAAAAAAAAMLSGQQLAAAAVAAQTMQQQQAVQTMQQQQQQQQQQLRGGRKKSQAQIDRRRERNRILARRTRLRKKFFFESLQKEVMDLQRENQVLKELVKLNLSPDTSKKILDECDAAEKLPPGVLEACGEGMEGMDSQDFNLVRSVQRSQHSFIITDPSLQDNPIVFASEGFIDLTGYTRDQLLGRNCRFLQGTETSKDKVDSIRKAISVGEDVTCTLINYMADGTPFWNKLFVAALRDAQNNIVNFIGVTVKVASPDHGDPEFGKLLPGEKPDGEGDGDGDLDDDDAGDDQ